MVEESKVIANDQASSVPVERIVMRCPKCCGIAQITRHGLRVCVRCLRDCEVRYMEWPPACRHGVQGPCGECQAGI